MCQRCQRLVQGFSNWDVPSRGYISTFQGVLLDQVIFLEEKTGLFERSVNHCGGEENR